MIKARGWLSELMKNFVRVNMPPAVTPACLGLLMIEHHMATVDVGNMARDFSGARVLLTM